MMWDDIAEGGVDEVVLNVYPAGMLIEPFVIELAKILRNGIDTALSCDNKIEEDSDGSDTENQLESAHGLAYNIF